MNCRCPLGRGGTALPMKQTYLAVTPSENKKKIIWTEKCHCTVIFHRFFFDWSKFWRDETSQERFLLPVFLEIKFTINNLATVKTYHTYQQHFLFGNHGNYLLETGWKLVYFPSGSGYISRTRRTRKTNEMLSYNCWNKLTLLIWNSSYLLITTTAWQGSSVHPCFGSSIDKEKHIPVRNKPETNWKKYFCAVPYITESKSVTHISRTNLKLTHKMNLSSHT
jgi:hypothetical protein